MITRKIQLTELGLEEEEWLAVKAVLESGHLREGPKTHAFETLFAQKTGVPHAVATSSGTAALHLVYQALLKPGDEVFVPTFTFIATASTVVLSGAKPVFCDIDPDTWTLDPDDARKKLTAKTKAIAGVHLFGNACDIAALNDIANSHHLKLIWDAAQALGSRYQGKDIAQFPDAVCFSFYPSKNITTGEGGMIATSDEALAAQVRRLKNHGQREKYVHEYVGYNYRMSEMEAAIGTVQLHKMERFLAKRRALAKRYLERLAQNPFLQIQKNTEGAEPSFNYLSVALQTERLRVSRDEFVETLKKEGIPCAVHYPIPLHHQPCFQHLNVSRLPHAESLAKRIFSLPMHPFLAEEDVDFILDKIDHLTRMYAQ